MMEDIEWIDNSRSLKTRRYPDITRPDLPRCSEVCTTRKGAPCKQPATALWGLCGSHFHHYFGHEFCEWSDGSIKCRKCQNPIGHHRERAHPEDDYICYGRTFSGRAAEIFKRFYTDVYYPGLNSAPQSASTSAHSPDSR